jgi:O-methyltransferase
MFLKKLFGAMRSRPATGPFGEEQHPLDLEARTIALHGRAPLRRHLDVLYRDVRVGDEAYVDLYFRCLEETGTLLTPFTIFQRFQTRHDLLRYFLETLDVPGERAECGAYRGATALLLCHAWRSRHRAFDGTGLHLIDSFSGTSASTPHDYIPTREGGETRMRPFFPPGKTDVTADLVRGFFRQFPGSRIHEGWIPRVFDALPAGAWAYVHLDLTLYEPTLAALRWFHPKLSRGGVILCDGSVFCPGVQKALDEFSAESGAPYVMLGHREAVFLKD